MAYSREVLKLMDERNALVSEEEKIEQWDIADAFPEPEDAIRVLRLEIEKLKAERE